MMSFSFQRIAERPDRYLSEFSHLAWCSDGVQWEFVAMGTMCQKARTKKDGRKTIKHNI